MNQQSAPPNALWLGCLECQAAVQITLRFEHALFKCPECNKEYIIDVRTGQAIREKKSDEENENLFDDALDKVKQQQEGTEDRFNQAVKSQEGRQSKLDDAFDQARERAQENPDEKPYNPLEWD